MSNLTKQQKSEIFRSLNTEEEASFRKWARENYTLGQSIDPVWHPVVRDECAMMNDESLFTDELSNSLSYVSGSDPEECLNSILLDGLVVDEPETDSRGITTFTLETRWTKNQVIQNIMVPEQVVDYFYVECSGAVTKSLFFAKCHAMSMGQKPFVRVVGKLTTALDPVSSTLSVTVFAEHIQNLRR